MKLLIKPILTLILIIGIFLTSTTSFSTPVYSFSSGNSLSNIEDGIDDLKKNVDDKLDNLGKKADEAVDSNVKPVKDVECEGSSCRVEEPDFITTPNGITYPKKVHDDLVKNRADLEEVLKYTYTKDGNIVWLEKGGINPNTGKPSGWWHIAEEVREGGLTRSDEIIKAGLAKDKNEVKDLIFDIINTGNARENAKGYEYSKFINGKTPRVEVGRNGYVVTIVPN